MLKKEWTKREHARAAVLLDELGRSHRLWSGIRPPPPLKRSDLALLGMLEHMEHAKEPPKMTASKMAVILRQSLPAISQKLRALEGAGMITRQADAGDRRVAYVRLTAKGRATAHRCLDEMMERMERLLSALGDAEAAQLMALLVRLNDLMDREQREKREGVENGC